MTIRFSCTQLQPSNKKGILKPNADGYYTMPVGGLNVFNSAGHFYTANGAKSLFENSSQLMRRVKRGALRGEVGHPKQLPGQDEDDFLLRILSIEEKNVCAHFSELWLDFDNYKDKNGKPMVAIMALVAPSGPMGDFLQKQLDNSKENVCFSIRSLTEDRMRGGIYERTLRTVVTFDYVNEPGIHIAEKFKSTALENQLVDMGSVITQRKLARTLQNASRTAHALESMTISPDELFKSLGWSLESEVPASLRW
jgi:hypothetical protein